MKLGLFGHTHRAECRAIAAGAERLGWSVEWQRPEVWTPDQAAPFDVVVTMGLRMGGPVRDHYQAAGVPVLVHDLPVLRLPGYFALWAGELNRLPDAGMADRLGRVGLERVVLGDGILVCGQKGGDRAHDMNTREMRQWAGEACFLAKAQSPGSRVVWRPHPQERFDVDGAEYEDPDAFSLTDSLRSGRYGSMVVHNSTCGVEALRLGVPVYCAPEAFYAELGQATRYPHDGDTVLQPAEAERRNLFARIMACQWTNAEIADGAPLAITLERTEAALGAHG